MCIRDSYRDWFERGVFTLGEDCDEMVNDFGLDIMDVPMSVEQYAKIATLPLSEYKRIVDGLSHPQALRLAQTWIKRYAVSYTHLDVYKRQKQLSTLPAFTDREQIAESLKNPENNEFDLREATHSMIYLTYPLYRLQMLYEGILKYRSYIEPRYVDKKEMNTPRFKSDWKLVDMWQKKLNPQKQFRRIVAEVIPEGKRAYYLRQSYNSTTGSENVNRCV